MRRLVLRNQAGSVDAARDGFQMAVTDLARGETLWPGHVAHLITHRHPFPDFAAAFGPRRARRSSRCSSGAK